MKRRDFIKKSFSAAVAAGTVFSLAPWKNMMGNNPSSEITDYDLVAVMDTSGEKNEEIPVEMYKQGINAMGGMQKFVKSGWKVVVKPNIGWDVRPELAANSNPHLVKKIVADCFDAGASQVVIFDNTCDEWTNCYNNSKIRPLAEEAGALVVPGNKENDYQEVDIPQGKKLKKAKVHKQILECDAFINVPILKSHGSARLTIAMKNLMGIVWDRRYWHMNNLHQCIADFATYSKKPVLNIVDAYRVMKQNGPRGTSEDDVIYQNTQLLSTDMVAVDAAAAKYFGYEPDEVNYIAIAHEMGVGNMNLEELSIKRIKI